MDAEQIKEDVRQGRITAERLVDLLATLLGQLDEARRGNRERDDRIDELQKAVDELQKKLGGAATAEVSEPYSVDAEERRQESRGRRKKKRRPPRRSGRFTTAEKVAKAQRREKVFPQGVAEADCTLSHTRPVWRLIDGQAVLVAYEVYRGPGNRYGQIPGVMGRSEYALEIVVAIAYQVYIVGLSFDKVCLVMNFFQNLPIRKSQADALLNQLSRMWEGEFERLCTLLANSAVVHTDETGWSLNSVWAFLSEKVRVILFGVHKDAATLALLLDPATFAGIVISDDAAVYANFTHAQKCWAHLLRKAIKLTLQAPHDQKYRTFADRLLDIYRAACRAQRDGRLSDAGREKKVIDLGNELLELCADVWTSDTPSRPGPEKDFQLLVNELVRLQLADQLFTFVTAPPVVTPQGEVTPVAGTNNEAERTLRGAAMARKTGRTNKTPRGARRQTVLVSVLESLRRQLATFTLASAIGEILHWSKVGTSRFERLLRKHGLKPPAESVLDSLFPLPGG
jgi:transposase